MLSVASSSEKRIDVGSGGSNHWSSYSPHASSAPLVLSTPTMTLEDPPAVSSFVRPTSGAVAWAAGGTDHVASSDTTVAASNCA